MFLRLDYVNEQKAVSVVSADELKAGQIVKIKGLAKSKVGEVPVDGEIFEAVKCVDDANAVFAVVAPNGHEYDSSKMWNHGELANIPANEPVRAYVLDKLETVTVEKECVTGGVVAGDYVAVGADTYTLAKSAGTEKAIVGQVLEVCKLGTNLVQRDAVKVMFVR